MPRDLLEFSYQALAVWRLTRLVTEDEITRPVREAVARTGSDRATYLVNCPHCVSVWVAALVPALPPKMVRSLALAGAVSLWHEVREG